MEKFLFVSLRVILEEINQNRIKKCQKLRKRMIRKYSLRQFNWKYQCNSGGQLLTMTSVTLSFAMSVNARDGKLNDEIHG